jgi:hypothetical protein
MSMRWPWTSLARMESERWYQENRISELRAQMLARIEDADDEINWLREKNDHLTEQIVRIQRHQAGLHEIPKQPKPALEPMPKEVREYISGFGNPSIRKDMRDRAYRQHARGVPWSEIAETMLSEEEGADDESEG